MPAADFPFHDGQRFLIDDDQEQVHTVVCRHRHAAGAGADRVAVGFSLTTAGGLPVNFQPDTADFRIPILGRNATRRV